MHLMNYAHRGIMYLMNYADHRIMYLMNYADHRIRHLAIYIDHLYSNAFGDMVFSRLARVTQMIHCWTSSPTDHSLSNLLAFPLGGAPLESLKYGPKWVRGLELNSIMVVDIYHVSSAVVSVAKKRILMKILIVLTK